MPMPSQTILITPSILSADLGKLQKEIEMIEDCADWMQVDVMDGHFVPNLTFGAPVLKWIKTSLPLDIHLMVSNPHQRVPEFIKVGAKHITFHAEAVAKTADRKHLISELRSAGVTAGIAINPGTPISAIADVTDDIDLVLVMSVMPGFSGQKFMPEVLEKVSALRQKFPALMIQIDGGVNAENAGTCKKAGVNNLVAASFIFGAKDRRKAIESLRKS